MANDVMTGLFNRLQLPKFESYLNLSSFSHKLTSSNVANISTPGYESRSIDFKNEYLRLTQDGHGIEGKVTNARHIPLGNHPNRPPDVDHAEVKRDQLNSVDIDSEVAKMAQNELRYTISARLLKRKFDGIKKAITSK